MIPPERPLLVYDGDCAFCRAWIERWRRATGERVEYAPSQDVAARFSEIPPERFRQSVVLIEPDGRVTTGARAVFRSLAESPGGWLGNALYERLPGFAPASEAVYGLIARHRDVALRITRLLWGEHVAPSGERAIAWLFIKLLAIVYAAAFASLGVQIVGLAGHDGILPIAELLAWASAHVGPVRYWVLPTLSWWAPGDLALSIQCWTGCGLAVLLLLGVAPALTLVLLWALYLSLSTAGQDFLWFQWDSLLLEAGFLAIFLAPWGWRSRLASDPPPPRFALWMLRWLLFRVMFCSAAVKWSSGDQTWHEFTALRFYYETQPLPPWTAWYAHHLPGVIQRVSTGAVFVIEGLVPFLVFAPRRLRIVGAIAMAGFQALIAVSGNYGFFNLLTIALCVLLLDDGVAPIARWSASRGARGDDASATYATASLRAALARPVLVMLLALSAVPLVRSFRPSPAWMRPLEGFYRTVSPLHLVSPYGLFAVMTVERPEIQIEGSDDGVTWIPYVFRWKAGDLARRPEFVPLHMPRLDWQMWFAALDTNHFEAWFVRFCERLLQGSRPVLALMGPNPFRAHPPRYLRAVVYDYRFTNAAARRASGGWWRREGARRFGPVLTLENGRLAAVDTLAAP